MVRYADDFVVCCENQREAEDTLQTLKAWLAERGLRLSEAKTRVVHVSQGFDFLGFNVRLYEVPNARSRQRLLIKPSKDAIKKLRVRLRAEWRALVGRPITEVINRLYPIITGWANDYRHAVSSEAFSTLEHWMFKRQRRWAKRSHPNKSRGWLRRYWGAFNPARPKDRWVFGDPESGAFMPRFSWTKIERHVKVKGDASLDDARLRACWWARGLDTTRFPRAWVKLARAQGFKCPVCGESLFNDEEVHRHHVQPRRVGGSLEPENTRLLHLFCHQQVHGPVGARVPRAVRRLRCEA